MKGKRLVHQLRFLIINNSYKRGRYIKKKYIFHSCGENVSFQPRKVPLYGELISIGDNVVIASDVRFCTHDGINSVFSRAGTTVHEKVGCIKVGNNCFIGAGATLMYDTCIGDDCIVAAEAVVIRDVPSGSIVGGVPAKVIGKTEDLVKKYKSNHRVAVYNESIDHESATWFWNEFYKKRK